MKYKILTESFNASSEAKDIEYKIDQWGIDVDPNFATFTTCDGILHKVPLCKIEDIRSWEDD